VAWPVLKLRDLPAVLFVPTAYPDHPERVFWWDRLSRAIAESSHVAELETPLGALPLGTAAERARAFRSLREHLKSTSPERRHDLVDELCSRLSAASAPSDVLSWDELRALAADGVTLASHTCTHPLMDQIPLEAARREVADSLADLEREIGSAPPLLAYPGGNFSAEVVDMLEREGVRAAFTTVRGINHLDTADPLRLRRINIGPRAGPATLRARILESAVFLGRGA
jgi:peptidoglycan/xylan/chitin deacetylase (PgdA/CDA1 family)